MALITNPSGSALALLAVLAVPLPVSSAPQSPTKTEATPIQPLLIPAPMLADFPGTNTTLYQPVNVLQPIPPAIVKFSSSQSMNPITMPQP